MRFHNFADEPGGERFDDGAHRWQPAGDLAIGLLLLLLLVEGHGVRAQLDVLN